MQLWCANEKMPFLLLIPCVRKSQAALLLFILVQILSGSSKVKASFQVHSDTPLNLIFFHFGTMTQIIPCCCFLWHLLMFSSSERRGSWFYQSRIRKQTALKRLFLSWAGSEKVCHTLPQSPSWVSLLLQQISKLTCPPVSRSMRVPC